jgi:hypothetical protein
MWFRRRRRRQSPPPLLLPSLERLAELVARVIALLDEALPALPALTTEPAQPAEAEPVPGHVLFVAAPAGYRLLQRDGAPPAWGEALELEGVGFRVVRLGPSPLPADRRRCAFVERQEPPRPERSFDG